MGSHELCCHVACECCHADSCRCLFDTGPRIPKELLDPSCTLCGASCVWLWWLMVVQAEARARREAEGQDAQYPDEVDVPPGVEARKRFQKYRCVTHAVC
jgi:hypothetical protein